MLAANHGCLELASQALFLLYTKLLWRKARLIRLPFRMRGKSAFVYGNGLTTGYSCRIEIGGSLRATKLSIGGRSVMGDYVLIVANHSVTIKENVLIASRVFITDTLHVSYKGDKLDSSPLVAPNQRELSYAKVSMGDNVWIGENVSILPGVSIGSGRVFGSNSVVAKSIQYNCIIAAIPGVVIKRHDDKSKRWYKMNRDGIFSGDKVR